MSVFRKVAVIGLGYVGLPVAAAFAQGQRVVAFDIDGERVAELRGGRDRKRSVRADLLKNDNLHFTDDPADLHPADFYIVCVPTPIDGSKQPDLRALFEASTLVGSVLKPGDIVVYESTVYPGATEEDCAPLLAHASGLISGRDFTVGYSPERINPGDSSHRFETIRKIVAGQDERTCEIIAQVYGSVVKAGVFRAPNIRTAEAAKVIENTQRDLNIALINELSAIFQLLDIDTHDVLEAAGTKWNFLPFTPGLVGGHCIGVDPYYLTHRAQRVGHHPEVILAGRRVNDQTGVNVAQQCIRMLLSRNGGKGKVTVLGLSFKENVPDVRNSRVTDIVRELSDYGMMVQVYDPIADPDEAQSECAVALRTRDDLVRADAVIYAVAHDQFIAEGWPLIRSLLKGEGGIVLDVKAKLARSEVPQGVELWRP